MFKMEFVILLVLIIAPLIWSVENQVLEAFSSDFSGVLLKLDT